MNDPATLQHFERTAVRLAQAAGEVLLAAGRERGRVASDSKAARRELVTSADTAAEHVVVSGLLEAFPDHAIHAEEGALTPRGAASSDSDYVWIVDPLDGTTNFVHGLPYYCTAIGLAHRGIPIAGAVHAPALGTTFRAHRGGGAFQDDAAIEVSSTDELPDALLATGFAYFRDRPGRDDNVERLGRALHACRDLRRYGSAQLDLCYTAAGVFDGYWEMYLEPYDVAAGAVVVREAGGTVTDLVDGEDWLYTGNICASNRRLHQQLLRIVGGAVPGSDC